MEITANNSGRPYAATVILPIDARLTKVCPVCKAAPGGKCLEPHMWGRKYIDTPHDARFRSEQ